ncbi:OPT superfamily oligopeptide transporter [Aspergillus karnatakaensis]|uniref:OPT superfamily oligopeptide transporter n=1 Tax=Aspergillus karnatakaensis TaxID=1810916 RepID=UPI003CCE259A
MERHRDQSPEEEEEENHNNPPSDPFLPFSDTAPDNRPILTLRSMLIGSLCGTLVNASNIYLGLKAGWTTSANIFGSVIGFVNNIAQTAATAAGGLSGVFVSAIPALYQLGLLQTPGKDYLHLTLLTGLGGLFGLFSIAPLRHFFLVRIARDLDLRFPSSTATATTIRSMHQAVVGGAAARRKLRVMATAFFGALALRVASQYAIGILWDWHPFTWMVSSGVFVQTAMALESWGWFIQWTPAFVGSGMLVSVNVAVSFLGGSVLAWGIIGPYLVSKEMAFRVHRSNETQWQGLMTYSSLSKELATAEHPSPRYWLLWPGVMCMTATAIAELLCQWRVIWTVLHDACGLIVSWGKQVWNRGYKYTSLQEPEKSMEESHSGVVRSWMWLPGIVLVVCGSCLLFKAAFGVGVAETLLALFLAFAMSLLAIQATGATDQTPIGTLSKVSQVILGSANTESNIRALQRLNLIGGALTNTGASQATDLMGDFRVGYLLGTPASLQYATQIIGTVFDPNAEQPCESSLPAASAWRAIAVAATEPVLPIPKSSLIFSIALSILGAIMVLIRQYIWVGKREWMRNYHPNLMIMAMAFTLPATHYGTAMVIGAIIASVWRRRSPGTFEEYGSAIAAALMAGEGIGDRFGTSVGCPAHQC